MSAQSSSVLGSDSGVANRQSAGTRQRGATLLVGLILLLLLTIHALAAFHTSSTQLRIVGNAQDRQAAEAAANQAIGRLLDAGTFATDPSSLAPEDIDIDGDGTPDYTVALAAACTAVHSLRATTIDADADADFGCVSSAAAGAPALCVLVNWDLAGSAIPVASAARTGAAAEVHQGASVRMTMSEAINAC